jgi:hypothetical protein
MTMAAKYCCKLSHLKARTNTNTVALTRGSVDDLSRILELLYQIQLILQRNSTSSVYSKTEKIATNYQIYALYYKIVCSIIQNTYPSLPDPDRNVSNMTVPDCFTEVVNVIYNNLTSFDKMLLNVFGEDAIPLLSSKPVPTASHSELMERVPEPVLERTQCLSMIDRLWISYVIVLQGLLDVLKSDRYHIRGLFRTIHVAHDLKIEFVPSLGETKCIPLSSFMPDWLQQLFFPTVSVIPKATSVPADGMDLSQPSSEPLTSIPPLPSSGYDEIEDESSQLSQPAGLLNLSQPNSSAIPLSSSSTFNVNQLTLKSKQMLEFLKENQSFEHILNNYYKLFKVRRSQIIAIWTVENPSNLWEEVSSFATLTVIILTLTLSFSLHLQMMAQIGEFDYLRRKVFVL